MSTESPTRVQRGYRITGRVQGVGFRWWTTRTAGSLGIEGTVRNRPDGSVEIHAAGTPDGLDAFEERLHRGPSSARVRDVEEIDSERSIPDGDFRIIR